MDDALTELPATVKRWTPRRVLVTRSAAELPHGQEIVRRCEAPGSRTSSCSAVIG